MAMFLCHGARSSVVIAVADATHGQKDCEQSQISTW